uniref:CSON011977 protein n=1 Tax=Culicoides sonorensis TaxID=179676 RepID=A0A336M562_CULSO
MKLKVIASVVFLMAVSHYVTGQEKSLMPPGYKVCSRSAPTQERNACLKESMTGLFALFKNGYPPLDVEVLDPYQLGTARFEYSTGPLSTRINMRNAIAHGASKGQVKNIRSKVNDQNLHFEMDVYFPKLLTEADFKGRSVFNDVKVKSDGHVKLVIGDVSCTFKMYGKARTDNPAFMNITSFDMTNVQIQKLKIDGTGFLPDPDANQFAIEFVNQNWREYYNSIVPSTKSSWEPIFLNLLNKVFDKVPFDQIMSK